VLSLPTGAGFLNSTTTEVFKGSLFSVSLAGNEFEFLIELLLEPTEFRGDGAGDISGDWEDGVATHSSL